jgi:hypothetical protein
MAWESLATRLDTLPNVIAGPLLRQVTHDAVTVWVALRRAGTVTLNVFDGQQKVMVGTRPTVAIGKNLHMVAVTANRLPPWELKEGKIYTYDLDCGVLGSSLKSLSLTKNAPLSYSPFELPSFALPPKDLNRLRLLQGSCRKPAAEGRDMMPVINRLILESTGNAYARPHQLLLTGDQIYADEVAYAMSLMLEDAAEALLGWNEQYKGPESQGAPQRSVKDLHPGLRWSFLKNIGLTSEDVNLHLIGLGEYLAMYLFVWSDVLWPGVPATLPDFDELDAEFKRKMQAPWEMNVYRDYGVPKYKRRGINNQNAVLNTFSKGLPEVRRVLANIPSYMIFDDHDVTDDWNMTRSFCQSAYGNDLGLRLVQNGLTAYALCQHWGNVPEDFALSKPGGALLTLLDIPQPPAANAFQNKAADYDAKSKDIRKLLGIHDAATLRARDDKAVYHDPDTLRYNFTVEGAGHQVIFTDTRTWRSYPSNESGTHLLTKNQQTNQFREQILDAPDTDGRQLFVVISTNVPPVQPIRGATRNHKIVNIKEYHPDVYEAWDLPSPSFDRLLVALTSKLPKDASGQHAGSVILLSGDVHHSFASRIIYRASKRFEDDAQPRGATAVIAQLVASSLKKQTGDTVRFHRKGYLAAPIRFVTKRMIRQTLTEGYVGWNFPPGTEEVVGSAFLGHNDPEDLKVGKYTVDVTPTDPLEFSPDSTRIDLTKKPHYRYRFDYLKPDAQSFGHTPPSIMPLPDSSTMVGRAYQKAMEHYRLLNKDKPPTVVGVNNFAEVNCKPDANGRPAVHHVVYWQDPDTGDLKNTTYVVRLDLNSPTDPDFKDIKARTEPQP